MDSDLKSFVKTQISSLSDADPEILADYILALITESRPSNEIKTSLKEKLNEFFEDQTDVFIDRLFNHLDKNSETKTSSSNSKSYQIEGSDDDEEDGDRSFKHRRHKQDIDTSRNEYNKRQLSEYEESNTNKIHRPYKPHRDDPSANDKPSGSSYSSYNNNHSNRRGNRMNGSGRGGKRNYLSKPVCRDYNEKGYCVRGDLCPYDHGSDSIVVDEGSSYNNNSFGANPGNQMMPMVPGAQPFFNIPPNFFGTEAYDPESSALMQNAMANFPMNLNAGMMPPIPDNILKSMMMMQQQQQQQQGYAAAGGPIRKTRGVGIRGRGGYGNSSNDRISNNKTQQSQQQQQYHHQRQQQTAIVVDNIPPEMCDMTKINEYFKKFGTITNIKLQLQKAIVHFNTHAEAEAAYSSPDAIFDNRFVKVYWYKEGDEKPTIEPKPKIQSNWKPQPPPPTISSEPDPNEVAAKAAELAKLREEKQKKRQEQMKAVLDAQKQREQLLQEKIDQQKKLLAKLSDKSLTPAEKEELLVTLKKVASDISISKSSNVATATPITAPTSTPTASTATTTTATATDITTTSSNNPNESSDQLKEKLAKLEAEAATLGISPDGSSRPSTYPSARGGGSFYGYRGGWPRVVRGGMKRSLDNRPTKILIKNIPEDINKDELQQHFQQFGNLVSFDNNENDFIAHYSQRYEAEKAMAIGSKFPAGQLTLSWYTNTTPITQNPSDQESKA